MSKEQKIIYEPHPVSIERKKELRALGYRIVDARFAPSQDAPRAASLPPPPAAPAAPAPVTKPQLGLPGKSKA